MLKKLHFNRMLQPSKGMSLIEVAIAMGLVSICVGLMLQMIGGTKVNMTQGDMTQGEQSFASHSQLNSHQSHEYMFAAGLAQQVSNGDFAPFITNPDNKIFCQWSNLLPQNLAPGGRTNANCTNTSQSRDIFYRWQVVRSNNAVSGLHTTNPVTGTNFPDANYPIENQLYQARLLVYNDAARQNLMFTFPVTMFRNIQAPPPVQSNLIANVSMDSSGSMALTHNGLPRLVYAKESLREFVNTVGHNPYVSKKSVLSLHTFNTFYPDAYNSEVPFTAPDTSGNFPVFQGRINCILPANNECIGQSHIVPLGQTNLNNPMSAALQNISSRNNLYNPNPVPTNPEASKRNYDKLWIFISDGNDTTSTPSENYQNMRAMARQFGFNANKEDRITIFTVGLLGSDINGVETANQSLLREMTQNTPNGIYIPARDVSELQSAFGNISNQFQFFSLKHKPERWGVYF